MSKSDTSARRASSTVFRYGLAILSVAVALFTTLLLPRTVVVTSLFFPAIMLSAWFGGIGPGLLAMLLSAVALNYYLLHPIHTMKISHADLPYLFSFLLSSLLVSSWSATRKRAESLLRQARDELETKVR